MLRNNDILNQDFCSKIYEYCICSNELLKSYDTLKTINNLNLNDYVTIGDDILCTLTAVESYLTQLQSRSY